MSAGSVVTMTATYLPDATTPRGWGDGPTTKPDAWNITLTIDDRSWSTMFCRGQGLRKCGAHNGKHKPAGAIDVGPWIGTRPDYARDYIQPRIYVVPPRLGEVLDCIASDCRIAEECRDEWDFFDELGYDPSRESLKVWHAIRQQADQVRDWLGPVRYRGLLDQEADELGDLFDVDTIAMTDRGQVFDCGAEEDDA